MGNPLILALRDEANRALQSIAEANPFLYAYLATIHLDRSNPNHLAHHGIIAAVRVIDAAGLLPVLTSFEAFDRRPGLFWTLMDEALRQDSLCLVPRAVKAILNLYRCLDKEGRLGKAFGADPMSPLEVLRTRPFQTFMLEHFTGSENTYRITYSKTRHPAFITLRYRNRELCLMATDAFTKCLNKYDRVSTSMNVLYDFESLFEGHLNDIHGYRDLDERVLTDAIAKVMEGYEGKDREYRMRFLFHFFSVQVLEHPEYDFFRNSLVWNGSIILDRRIPVHLANGFRFAVFGQTNYPDQNHGILMVVKNGKDISANGRNNSVFTFDLRNVTEPLYWTVLSRYIIQTCMVDIATFKTFFLWLQERKRDSSDPSFISQADLRDFHAYVSGKYKNPSYRNDIQNGVRKILSWAESEHLMTVFPGAYDEMKPFETCYIVEPGPVGKEDIAKLTAALEEMGKENIRYALDAVIVNILIRMDARLGAVCTMRLRDLKARGDGSYDWYAREKNSGHDPRYHHIPAKCNLAKAIAMTEEVRRKCPKGSVEDHVFIYPEPNFIKKPFCALNNNRFGQDLKIVQEKYGLRPVKAGNLRDTYMSAVTSFARRHGLTDLQQAMLTKHRNKMSTGSYIRINLDEVLVLAEQIRLGEVG